MYAERHDIALTTNGDGDCTAYSAPVTGRISSIVYTKDDFADGVDFDITLENSGEVLLSVNDLDASATFAPRQPTHSTAGAALVYIAAGQAVNDYIVACDDRVKVVVASGGDTKSGTIRIVVT